MKVVVVAGFTGSGKTTLIKKLLKNDKSVTKTVIVNEKGDEQYEDGSVSLENTDIYYIPQGCICCTLTMEFKTLLEKILKNIPDTLYLELAGTCLVKDVVSILQDMHMLDGSNPDIITVVSAEECTYFSKYMGDFYTEQIISADKIMITYLEDISADEQSEVMELLKDMNRGAEIICT